MTDPEIKVRFRDLSVSDDGKRAELVAAVEAVLRHGRILQGPEVRTFERQVAEDCGTAFAIGVASGTAAIYLSLRSLDIGPGDEAA